MSSRRGRSTDTGRVSLPRLYPPRDKPKGRTTTEGQQSTHNQVPQETDIKTLTVKSCDLNIRENSKAHNTWRYEISTAYKDPKLVVRRGQPFDINLTFSREYDPSTDDLKLIFEAGDLPNPTKGTQVEFFLTDRDKPKEWGAKIVSNKGSSLKISIFTPPTVYVGKWQFSVEVIKKDEPDTVDVYTYEHYDPIYILFNPWCKDDSVYLDDDELIREYILNETGKIYCGSCRNITSRPWNFGQFESVVLDVALYLLDAGSLAWTSRGNPIQVVRKLSAMINSNDDGGVLVGNWSGEYSEGKSPLSWTGSVAILEKYWEHKRPVKFGQCWVFSGVSTAVCRALGIPARSVTNFASAHDTDGSVTIDVIFNDKGEKDDYKTDDSIWNFHVWNEAWMARPDLPIGFGGWQAFDATPQELSDDVFACGPVSVQAIKQGEINLPYDAPFVFAEVNADRMFWYPFGRKLTCLGCDQKCVGKFISTKQPNSWMRLDLTNTYKPEEGSAEERACVLKANQLGSNRQDIYLLDKKKDVTFSLTQDSENTWVGGDFDASLQIRNNSKKTRTVSGRIVVSTMYYTGVVANKIKSEPFGDIKLKAGEEHNEKVKIPFKEYDGKLKDCCMLDMSVLAVIKETNQHHTSKDDFRLRKPHLTIKAPSSTKAATEFNVDVSFTNPLESPLTNCSVTVDGLSRSLEFPQGNVGPKGTFMATLPITPKKLGHTELILNFNSLQLEDINGSHPIFIQGEL